MKTLTAFERLPRTVDLPNLEPQYFVKIPRGCVIQSIRMKGDQIFADPDTTESVRRLRALYGCPKHLDFEVFGFRKGSRMNVFMVGFVDPQTDVVLSAQAITVHDYYLEIGFQPIRIESFDVTPFIHYRADHEEMERHKDPEFGYLMFISSFRGPLLIAKKYWVR